MVGWIPVLFITDMHVHARNHALRVDFIGFDNKIYPPWENAVKIGKWSGTFMAKLKLPQFRQKPV